VRARLASLGLRWRLAGWVTVVVLLCTAISFVAVYRGTGTQVRGQIDREIGADVGDLSRDLARAHAGTAKQVAAAAAAYVHDQSFSVGSSVLFVIVPGAGTSTNRPELFDRAAVPDDGETVTEQGEENRLAVRLAGASDGYATLDLPDVGQLRVLKRTVRLPGGRHVTVGAGESLAAVEHAQSGVGHAFVLAEVLALVAAALGAFLIGTRVSAPLRRMASVAARVDAGDLHPRIHDAAGQSAEVKVLAESFNHMLDRLTEAFAGQRAFVADASHELRTPLTVIRGQLELLASQPDPSSAEVLRIETLVQAEIDRMARLVEDLLLLARSEQEEFLHPGPIELATFVTDLFEGTRLLADRRFELGRVPAGVLNADPDRLAQALRNLIGNAIEHTAAGSGRVCLTVEVGTGGRARFVVEDDGAGIPPDQLERVFDRFHRTDDARDRNSGGAGLGLAIVRAIVHAHGGRVWAELLSGSGTRIVAELPGFSPGAQRHDGVRQVARLGGG